MAGTQSKMADYAFDQIEEATRALLNTVLKTDGVKLGGDMKREAEIMEAVSNFHMSWSTMSRPSPAAH